MPRQSFLAVEAWCWGHQMEEEEECERGGAGSLRSGAKERRETAAQAR